MKPMTKLQFLRLIPAILLGAPCELPAWEGVTVRTEDTGAALVNPGMGWTMHFTWKKLDTFLAALARRYDGNPNVEFIDVGTYGMWGEGHTFMSSKQDTLEIRKLHIDLHLKHLHLRRHARWHATNRPATRRR
jgi:hypothetical protein